MLRLHIIQAAHGDCLLLEYGAADAPRYALVDGGPPPEQQDHLRAHLTALGVAGGQIDLVVLSHVDDDHVGGLLELFGELENQRRHGEPGFVSIRDLWHNSFDLAFGPEIGMRIQTMMAQLAAIENSLLPFDFSSRSISQGDNLTRLAEALDIELNAHFTPDRLILLEEAPPDLAFENLALRIVGPTRRNLLRLRRKWIRWLEQQHSLLANDDFAALAPDQSIPNLSSIMFLAAADGRTILFTGDGRGDHILRGLREIGLLGDDGTLHVDVLKVPHHGSSRNTTRAFYRQVTADVYVICADGSHANPDYTTLRWIVECAHAQGRPIDLFITSLTPSVERLLKRYDAAVYGYRIITLAADQHALTLELV